MIILDTRRIILFGVKESCSNMPPVPYLVIQGKAEAAAGAVPCQGIDGRKIRGQEHSDLQSPVYFQRRAFRWGGRVIGMVGTEGGIADPGIAAVQRKRRLHP